MALKSDLCHQQPSITVLNLSRVQRSRIQNSMKLNVACHWYAVFTLFGQCVITTSTSHLISSCAEVATGRTPLVFSLLRSHPDVVARMRNKLEIRKKLSPDTSCFILYAYWSLIIYFEALEFSRTSLRTTCTYYVMHIAHYNVQDTFVAEASSYVKGRTS